MNIKEGLCPNSVDALVELSVVMVSSTRVVVLVALIGVVVARGVAFRQ